MKKMILVLMTFALLATMCFAAPKEIIIIRHADKWKQNNPGPFLSPKGQLRAEKFISYYLSHFPKPDFIFATNPKMNPLHITTGYSYRPLQTVMPLANHLAQNNPNGYPINAIFHDNQYPQLAHLLLTHPKYKNKIILICWHHGKADSLAHAFGVTQKLAKWQNDDFDQVFVLKYNDAGKLIDFQILKNQYPVSVDPTWTELSRS